MYLGKTLLVSTAVVMALALILAPSAMSENAFAKIKYKNWSDCREDHSNNWCKNYFKKHDNNDNKKSRGNSDNQGIGQSQSSNQNSQCVSGGDMNTSCNNLSFQNQENSGNNAAAQQGKGKGANSANQGIGQSQSSNQNSQCVSGKDATVSCNNVQFQNQVNSGNNALGQIR